MLLNRLRIARLYNVLSEHMVLLLIQDLLQLSREIALFCHLLACDVVQFSRYN
jgi:hypothetical protein